MTIRFLKEAALSELKGSILKNLPLYRAGDFSFLEVDGSKSFSVPTAHDPLKLADIKLPQAGDLFEVENCVAVHGYLSDLSPYDARDERLWAYLAHTTFLEYSRARWPIPDDDEEAVKHIHQHFFAIDKRQIERGNAVSRLWWMAHLCSRIPGMSLEQALQVFLHRADVRANIVERPTVSQSVRVFSVVLRKLLASFNGQKALFNRTVFRKLMIELNSIGGFRLLDCLPEQTLVDLVDDVVSTRLNLSSV